MKHYKWVKDEINKLLMVKVLRRSQSSWWALIIVVPKGNGGKHLVINYCALNKVTWKFIWPMPKVEDIFSQLNGAKYFSMLDLWAGKHHIPLDESLIPKTAFTSPFGKYEYTKVTFGLTQAPAYFQELMTGVLKDFPSTVAYLDDITFSKTAEEHLYHIKQVFKKLWNSHLLVGLSKCHFFTKEIQYLRHIHSTTGIRPLPPKSHAINNMHPSKTAKQVCTFLGLTGYYRKCIKNLAKMAKPLTLLTQQKAKFEWTPVHHTTFFTLKDAVTQAPILHYPDPTKWYIVYTDASEDVCGAQLSQEHDGTEFPIVFLSHNFMDTQRKWEYHWRGSLWSILCSYKVELLPLGSWSYHMQQPQTTGKVSKWKECQ